MMRIFLARALGVLVVVFGLAALWNAAFEVRFASGFGGYAVIVLDILAGSGVVGGYWLWRRDRRALVTSGFALAAGIVAGTVAAWTYTDGPDRASSTLGALVGGVVFGAAVVLLARMALKTTTPSPEAGAA